MRYIEAAARIKPSRKTVRDEWRKQDVITKAAVQAEKVCINYSNPHSHPHIAQFSPSAVQPSQELTNPPPQQVDFPPELVRNIYEVLVEGSIAHEFTKFDARVGEKSEDATEN